MHSDILVPGPGGLSGVTVRPGNLPVCVDLASREVPRVCGGVPDRVA